jgi:glucosylceramidase
VTETTDGGSMRLATRPDAPFSATPPPGIPLIDVDGNAAFQTVNGFGAALTDSSAWLIHDRLPPRRRATLLNDLFGAAGLDLQFLRLPMGASDFTVHGRPYSYDDLRPGRKDPHMRHFS